MKSDGQPNEVPPTGAGETQQRSVLERHLQSIALLLMLGLAGWNLRTTQELEISVAVATASISELRSQIAVGVEDRYRASDAVRDLALRDRAIDQLEGRLEKIERRLEVR